MTVEQLEYLQKQESDYQKFQDIYYNSNIEEERNNAWNEMFNLVHNCCSAIGKKLAYSTGKNVPDLDEKIMDGTIYVMENIKKKNLKIDKLSSYCYLRVYCKLYDKKTQQWEKTLSLEELNYE